MAEQQETMVNKPFPVPQRYLKAKRRAIRSLWCDKITITEHIPETAKTTHLTTFNDVVVLENAPCRIVSQTVDSTTTGEPAQKIKTITVMLDETVDVKSGSKIKIVSLNGREFYGKRTGEPIRKSDSQTITVEIMEEYA